MNNLFSLFEKTEKVVLGSKITLTEFMAVARFHAEVDFNDSYIERVYKSREITEKCINSGKVMYGVTTGPGVLCNKIISFEDAEKLQKNIIISHAASVGEPLSEEAVRGIMLLIIQNLGLGFSGVTLKILEFYKKMLNCRVTPFVPGEGSAGYLSTEAHIALAATGKGKAFFCGKLYSSTEALKYAGLKPVSLSLKEGLALISGTTSVTALGAIAVYDALKAALSADVIGAMSLEVLKGTVKAYDPRVMKIRCHEDQIKTADNLRNILSDSKRVEANLNYRLQDALSLRCIPQLHGAAKKTLKDALVTIESEMNSCTDNPVIWPENDGEVISSGNPDSSYVGIEMDSALIAMTCIAKMSERRNSRMIDSRFSEMEDFLVKNPGLNSGLMIPQYTQAGLLNDMRTLSHPSTVDNTPTCAGQEDYVAMGYNASGKALKGVEKLNYILAVELLSVFQANYIISDYNKVSTVTSTVCREIEKIISPINNDVYLYPYIERLFEFIRNGFVIKAAAEKVDLKL